MALAMNTVGKQLQEARVAKGWSPELAARETKIKVERVRDLEADDYSNFSSPTYARGFVRTYARSLGVDEYKLLRQLDNKLPEDDNASFANDTGIPYMPEPSQVSSPFKFGTGVYVALGVGATVLLLIGFILFESYRAGYFAQALPSAAAVPTTNVAPPATADTEPVARALPADSNAAPVALPVDLPPTGNAANATSPTAPPVHVAPPTAATTPLDTKSPPRALPVDLATLTPADLPAPVPADAPAPASSTGPAPASPVPLSARQANARPAESVPTVAVAGAAAPVVAVAPVAADASPSSLAAAAPVLPASDPAPAVAPAADPGPVFHEETPTVPSAAAAPATPSATSGGKRLTLTASSDSFVRVVSLDDPAGEKVRYSSVLHRGESVSFGDRKYSINVDKPSAVDIVLDNVNYGPHSDHAQPDTFTVESHQP